MNTKTAFDEIETGTRLEIRRLAEGENGVLVSQLLAPLAGPLALIAIPIANCQLAEWPEGTGLEACFVQKGQGIWSFTASIISRSVSNQVQAYLVQLDRPPERYQRREFFRLDCTLDMVFRRVPEEAEGNAQPEKTDHPSRSGLTLNISGGGASFISAPVDETPEEIEIALTLEGFGPIVARGRVLRHEEFDSNAIRRQRFSIQFTGISPQDRNSLVRYVFRRQRRHLHES